MASAATTSHDVLSLRQESGNRNEIFQLNQQRNTGFDVMLITTFEKNRSVTLVCDGLEGGEGERRQLDMLKALRSGLYEIVESGKDQRISFDSTSPKRLGRMQIPPKPSPQHLQEMVRLTTDTTSEAWKSILQPGKTYDLRISKSNGEAWCYYTDEHTGPIEEVPPSQRLLVGREDGAIRFTVYDDPPPPTLFATLTTEPEECSLSPGGPPFKFIMEFRTDCDQPVTIDKSDTPLSAFEFQLSSVGKLVCCKDVETGDEVNWPCAFGCFLDGDPRPSFPDDDDFVEILPGKPWRFEYTLKRQGNSWVGGLEALEKGRTYEARISTEHDLTEFERWFFGRKEDLLTGTLEEKIERWDAATNDRRKAPIAIKEDTTHPAVFRAV